MGRYNLPYPMGWFKIAYAKDLAIGQVKPLRYFGRDLVLFRTEGGEARVLDAYCPHMGAHLGYSNHGETGRPGPVVGDSIVCPFHGWRFNGEGQCTEIPYAKNMPPAVVDKPCLKGWPVEEKNQSIYLWYHPRGEAPAFPVAEAAEAAADNEAWSDLQIHEWTLRTNMQDMGENGADPAHFYYVHGTAEMPQYSEVEFDGHTRRTVIESKMQTPKGTVDGRIEAIAYGPGQSIVRFSGICDTLLLGGTTPVDEEYVKVSFAFLQRKEEGKVQKGGVHKAIVADICKQLEEDAVIWEHKIYREKPILCDGDGPIARFRKWFASFYVEA